MEKKDDNWQQFIVGFWCRFMFRIHRFTMRWQVWFSYDLNLWVRNCFCIAHRDGFVVMRNLAASGGSSKIFGRFKEHRKHFRQKDKWREEQRKRKKRTWNRTNVVLFKKVLFCYFVVVSNLRPVLSYAQYSDLFALITEPHLAKLTDIHPVTLRLPWRSRGVTLLAVKGWAIAAKICQRATPLCVNNVILYLWCWPFALLSEVILTFIAVNFVHLLHFDTFNQPHVIKNCPRGCKHC